MIIKTMTEGEYCNKVCAGYMKVDICRMDNVCEFLKMAKEQGWITETAQSFDVSAKTKEPEMEYIHEHLDPNGNIYRMSVWETQEEAEKRYSHNDFIYHRLDWTGRPRELK